MNNDESSMPLRIWAERYGKGDSPIQHWSDERMTSRATEYIRADHTEKLAQALRAISNDPNQYGQRIQSMKALANKAVSEYEASLKIGSCSETTLGEV